MTKKDVNLRIYGMTCDDCVRTVTKGLESQEGIKVVDISLKDKSGKLIVDTEKFEISKIPKLAVFTKGSQYKAIIVE